MYNDNGILCDHRFPQVPYFKPRRIAVDGIQSTKNHLTPEQLRALFSDKVVVEEKMDGNPCAFPAEDRYLVFAEDMLRRHSVAYRIPGRYAVFDIFDMEREVFLDSAGKGKISSDLRKGLLHIYGISPKDFFIATIFASGTFRDVAEIFPFLAQISLYAIDPATGRNSHAEGLVIKPDVELTIATQLRAKIIRPEFDDEAKQKYLIMPEQTNLIDS